MIDCLPKKIFFFLSCSGSGHPKLWGETIYPGMKQALIHVLQVAQDEIEHRKVHVYILQNFVTPPPLLPRMLCFHRQSKALLNFLRFLRPLNITYPILALLLIFTYFLEFV